MKWEIKLNFTLVLYTYFLSISFCVSGTEMKKKQKKEEMKQISY